MDEVVEKADDGVVYVGVVRVGVLEGECPWGEEGAGDGPVGFERGKGGFGGGEGMGGYLAGAGPGEGGGNECVGVYFGLVVGDQRSSWVNVGGRVSAVGRYGSGVQQTTDHEKGVPHGRDARLHPQPLFRVLRVCVGLGLVPEQKAVGAQVVNSTPDRV